MKEYLPKVDETQEFIEIAYDFSNPLDLVREAISNSFDAKSKNIDISFDVQKIDGEAISYISIKDDGDGMDEGNLHNFFDLGNSSRKNDEATIGEKGHGTKVYFNCDKLKVTTVKNNHKLVAIIEKPMKCLHSHTIPKVHIEDCGDSSEHNGTSIEIYGYNNNRRDKFTHENLKDYILWFTKMGSIERIFNININSNVILTLKGADVKEPEKIKFGHVFPDETESINKLFDEYLVDAPEYFCKKVVCKSGHLEHYPETKYDAVFYIEGNKIKQDYNKMIRRQGYQAPKGSYTVRDRYGLWICKDYIPVQRMNEWIIKQGTEFTKFHAFVNCQDLRLTANRGSIENTPSELLEDLKNEVTKLYETIENSTDWVSLTWLGESAVAYKTSESEKRDFQARIKRVNSSKIAEYRHNDKNIRLIEPTQENGVFALFMQLQTLEIQAFPFTIIDYDTHQGFDVIVKENGNMPIKNSKLYYVEFKNYLSESFNHSFENLYSIVCWDINSKIVQHGSIIKDIGGNERTLKIVPPENKNDITRYFLDDIRSGRKIEVYVLKTLLKEKFNIDFRTRTEKDTF